MVSPFAKETESGAFTASVSVRSGHGLGSLDRVWRYVPLFENGADACSFALEQVLMELQDAELAPPVSTELPAPTRPRSSPPLPS